MRLSLILALVSLSCGEAKHELRIDLRTDFAAGTELVRTVTILSSEDEVEIAREERPVGEGLIEGVRIAQFGDLRSGIHRVSVELHGDRGVLVQRLTVVEVRQDTGVTVIATRDCRDVACDVLTTCSAGQCVDPTCSPEMPELCPEPECVSEADCGSGSECTTAVCLAGSCGLVASHQSCESGVCDVETGCAPPACEIEGREVALSFDDLTTRDGNRTLELFEDAALTATSPCGTALEIGPGRGWADIANDDELQAVWAGNFTMMAWVRSTQAPEVAVYPHVISKEQSTVPRRGANLILHGSPFGLDDTVLFEARDDPDELAQVRGSAVNDGEWHHIAGVREGDVVEVFVDGVLVADRPVNGAASFDEDLPLRLGAKSRFDGEAPIAAGLFEGAIDEVRIYDTAVTQSDVMRIYEEQLIGNCDCP